MSFLTQPKFRKHCPYCIGQNWKVDTTLEKIEICEHCIKTMIEQGLHLSKQKTRGGALE